MLSGMRNQVVALACLRHGLPSQQGRGADRLPADTLDPGMIPTAASIDGMNRAFARTVDALLREVDGVDTHWETGCVRVCVSLPPRRLEASIPVADKPSTMVEFDVWSNNSASCTTSWTPTINAIPSVTVLIRC